MKKAKKLRKFIVLVDVCDRFDHSQTLDLVFANDLDELARKIAPDYVDEFEEEFEEDGRKPWDILVKLNNDDGYNHFMVRELVGDKLIPTELS